MSSILTVSLPHFRNGYTIAKDSECRVAAQKPSQEPIGISFFTLCPAVGALLSETPIVDLSSTPGVDDSHGDRMVHRWFVSGPVTHESRLSHSSDAACSGLNQSLRVFFSAKQSINLKNGPRLRPGGRTVQDDIPQQPHHLATQK